jgi:hypothetical protein
VVSGGAPNVGGNLCWFASNVFGFSLAVIWNELNPIGPSCLIGLDWVQFKREMPVCSLRKGRFRFLPFVRLFFLFMNHQPSLLFKMVFSARKVGAIPSWH